MDLRMNVRFSTSMLTIFLSFESLNNKVPCRPPGSGPRLNRRARIQFGPFFVTYAGSQLTFMTQHKKVIIFRYLRGVTTDLLDV